MSLLDPAPEKTGLRIVDLVASRVTWVQVLSLGAILSGLSLAATGSAVVPFAITFGVIPGWPWVYGLVLALSGWVILWSIGKGHHLRACVAAIVAGAMYLVLAGGFIALWVMWLRDDIPRNALLPPYPAPVYIMVAALHFIHADTEGRAHRLDRLREGHLVLTLPQAGSRAWAKIRRRG
jgi:hypothetical protein